MDARLIEPDSTCREISLDVGGFAWEELQQAAAESGVSVEEMITFAVLYYLADEDRGRIARRVELGPYPEAE